MSHPSRVHWLCPMGHTTYLPMVCHVAAEPKLGRLGDHCSYRTLQYIKLILHAMHGILQRIHSVWPAHEYGALQFSHMGQLPLNHGLDVRVWVSSWRRPHILGLCTGNRNIIMLCDYPAKSGKLLWRALLLTLAPGALPCSLLKATAPVRAPASEKCSC
jgi:hypothetical protein